MKVADLARGVNTVAASTAVDMAAAGFETGAGRNCVVTMAPRGTAALDPDQAGQIQGSDDGGANYVNLLALAYDASTGFTKFAVTCMKLMRVNNTSGTIASTDFVVEQSQG